jgi:hypothetical protein
MGAVIVLGRRTVFVDGWQPEIPKIILMLATLAIRWPEGQREVVALHERWFA